MMVTVLGIIYVVAVSALSLYGFFGLLTLFIFRRTRNRLPAPPPPLADAALPMVTVQLPIYNERFVVRRLIDAVAALDYPLQKLQVQVLDDSSDDTAERAAVAVDHYRRRGLDITHHRRPHRHGFKAGALQAALPQARGDFLVLFDADFVPRPTFLRETIPHLAAEPALGLVQARWEHLNAGSSGLTAAQAIALDKHFGVDQTVRDRAHLFPKGNGSGMVLRRSAVEAAGGWQADTVCEDLCLSTRMVLNGDRFRLLNQTTAPAQLPGDIAAFKSQQARWAQGSLQCLRKYGRRILLAREQTRLARFFGLFSLASYLTHLAMLLVLAVLPPLLLLDYQFPRALLGLGIAGLGQPVLFVLSQQLLRPDWRRRLRHLPRLLLLAIGITPSNARALLRALTPAGRVFVRTPKPAADGQTTYALPFDPIFWLELGLTLYATAGLIIALLRATYGAAFFLLTAAMGFGYVVLLSLRAPRPRTRRQPALQQPTTARD